MFDRAACASDEHFAVLEGPTGRRVRSDAKARIAAESLLPGAEVGKHPPEAADVFVART
jgi:hypothetical protein